MGEWRPEKNICISIICKKEETGTVLIQKPVPVFEWSVIIAGSKIMEIIIEIIEKKKIVRVSYFF